MAHATMEYNDGKVKSKGYINNDNENKDLFATKITDAVRFVQNKQRQMAGIKDTFRFIFDSTGSGTKCIFIIGCMAAVLNGTVGPLVCSVISLALGTSGATIQIDEIMYEDLKRTSMFMCFVGVYALILSFIQTVCFDIVGNRAARSLGLQWFKALLRQDAAFFDVNDIAGIATSVHPSCIMYQNGVGRKLGEGIQYTTQVMGGSVFAIGASWKVAMMVGAAAPITIVLAVLAVHNAQRKSLRASIAYKKAGSVAYTAISSIKTVFAFNAVPSTIKKYYDATQEAYKRSTRMVFRVAVTNGLYTISVQGLFVVMALFGPFLMYREVKDSGCDPSSTVEHNEPCSTTGVRIVGAFLGFLFAAEGLNQVLQCLEIFFQSSVAVREALFAIDRAIGTPKEIIYKESHDIAQIDSSSDELQSTSSSSSDSNSQQLRANTSHDRFHEGLEHKDMKQHGSQLGDGIFQITSPFGQDFELTLLPGTSNECKRKNGLQSYLLKDSSLTSTLVDDANDDNAREIDHPYMNDDVDEGMVEAGVKRNRYIKPSVKAILPKFEIDSFSIDGLKPDNVRGDISFKNVCFSYPTRPGQLVLDKFSLEIEAGKTIALVGPSGGGKSTVISMIERFYDPTSGIIEMDGINIKNINLPYLRGLMGYVGQEPSLFATSIRENIEFGFRGASKQDVLVAAKRANAHDFITEFPDGYETHVGEKGSQLSGGQKQRIAIARALVSKPKILLLDEATSALDSESELVVQNAIDNLLANNDMTTVIIAHRLSTIRNADIIAVVVDNKIVERGTHSDLMLRKDGYYKGLVEEQEGTKKKKKAMSSVEKGPLTEDINGSWQQNRNNADAADGGGAAAATAAADDDDGHGATAAHTAATASTTTTGVGVGGSGGGGGAAAGAVGAGSSGGGGDDGASSNAMQSYAPPLNANRSSLSAPHIKFKNVDFSYPTRCTKQILRDFNLSIRAGETVAFVGPSGQGKSTTMALIERFYDPTKGAVEYMGKDIKYLNVHWYRDQIGYVGQEPSLVGGTIASNIAFGMPDATQKMIEEAAKQANAHSFIVSFPEGYETPVGHNGTQLSGGQKQRVAIARALVKKPKVLLLDEATSALDSESESLVQATLDELMETKDRTIIVIAHKLSTIRNVDKIAVIANGSVRECGSHAELMKLDGRYTRLVKAQQRSSTIESVGLMTQPEGNGEDDSDYYGTEGKVYSSSSNVSELSLEKGDTRKHFNAKRAANWIVPHSHLAVLGIIGSLMQAAMYPLWGLLFAETIGLLFYVVEACPNLVNGDENASLPIGFDSCEEYWLESSEQLRRNSLRVAMYWGFLLLNTFFGALFFRLGLVLAGERMIKRVRDATFNALLRQEVSFFDVNSIGSIMTVLQSDTMKIHTFIGEPIRAVVLGVSSIIIGIILACMFVWPVAIVAMLSIPFMGFTLLIKARNNVGTDKKLAANDVDYKSPNGIIAESLLNIRTVSALSLESRRLKSYRESLYLPRRIALKNLVHHALFEGFGNALHHWIFACIVWFGTWILYKYPNDYTMIDVLRSNFTIYFALFCLMLAFKEFHDREEVKQAAGKIFFLLDRKSQIDALSTEGIKL